MSLDPAVASRIEAGQLRRLDLIRFDLPGKTVGYHRGGRPWTYNGLTYMPNRYLSAGEANAAVGIAVTTRTVKFSNVPTPNPDDAIAAIEQYDYLNAPVIVTHLAGDPVTDEVVGVMASSIYEIERVRYSKSAVDRRSGQRTVTISVDLQPPGRSARYPTLVRRSDAEQRFDNLGTDTCMEYASVVATQEVKWGQRSG